MVFCGNYAMALRVICHTYKASDAVQGGSVFFLIVFDTGSGIVQRFNKIRNSLKERKKVNKCLVVIMCVLFYKNMKNCIVKVSLLGIQRGSLGQILRGNWYKSG